jgi:hypothetical protein
VTSASLAQAPSQTPDALTSANEDWASAKNATDEDLRQDLRVWTSLIDIEKQRAANLQKKGEQVDIDARLDPVLRRLANNRFFDIDRQSALHPSYRRELNKVAALRGQTSSAVIHGRAVNYSISMPAGWAQQRTGPDNTSFDIVMQNRDMFIGIIVGNALDIRRVLASFMDQVQFDEPSRIAIDGRDWMSIVAKGSNKGFPIACLGFSYSDTDRMYRIVAWTSKDELERNRPAINKVVGSFKFPPN